MEVRNVGFCGEGKTGVPGEKPLGAEKRTNNKLNPHMTSSPGIEPGSHWWKASALTTAPSLLHTNTDNPKTGLVKNNFTCIKDIDIKHLTSHKMTAFILMNLRQTPYKIKYLGLLFILIELPI